MVFTSSIFLFGFFPLSLVLFFCSPRKIKPVMLLLLSWFFYCWGALTALPILLSSIAVNYIAGLLISGTKRKSFRTVWLVLGIGFNLGLLFTYKYFAFFLENVNSVFKTGFSAPSLILPLGISFFTFQAISYLADVYKQKFPADKNLFHVCLYLSFFPRIISGPITRYGEFYTQLKEPAPISLDRFYGALQRIIVGFSKRLLISNIVGETADLIFYSCSTGRIDTPTAWLGMLCYTMQIYFDFSGYTDIAIGLGRLFGFDLPENFNYPYLSKSITEFWRRWHITLSTWFKDYLYIPLGGNRRGNVFFNLSIVFLATGIWHGASKTFILWGIWHGFWMILERLARGRRCYERIPGILKGLFTFLLVMIGWVMFRAEWMSDAAVFIKTLFGFGQKGFLQFGFLFYFSPKVWSTLAIALVASFPVVPWVKQKWGQTRFWPVLESCTALALFALSILYLVNSSYNPFIYFQF